MSTDNQFFNGAYEMGEITFHSERGSYFTRNGKLRLRSGTILPAAGYPLAAADGGLMVNGIASTIPANIAVTGWATNGTGTWIIAYGNASTVLISTDNLATLTTKTHNNANPVVDVQFNAASSRFITFGCSTSAVTCSYSANAGSTFTAGGSLTPGVTPTANTVRSACDGTICLAAWQSTASNTAVVTTADGVTLTSRTLAAATAANKQPLVAVLPSLGGARWLISNESSGQSSTAADGSAWVSANIPNGYRIPCGLAGGNGMFLGINSTDNGYIKSTNGTSWTIKALPSLYSVTNPTTDLFSPGGVGSVYPNWLQFDGERFVTGTANASRAANTAQGIFGYTLDGELWSTRQLTFPCESVAGSQLAVMSGNGYLGTLPAGVANQIGAQNSASWKTTCDYVGKARPVYVKGLAEGVSSPLVGYVGIN